MATPDEGITGSNTASLDEVKTGSNISSDEGGNTEKVTFTDAQQTKVQLLIDDAYRKAHDKANSNKDNTKELELVEKLKAKSQELDNLRNTSKDVDVSAMQKRIADQDKAIASQDSVIKENDALKKTGLINNAISKHDVHDLTEVASLISRSISVNEHGSLLVQGENGSPKLNAQGEPMTVDQFIESWLKERPHHLKPSGNAGSGSSQVGVNKGVSAKYDLSDPSIWKNMPKEDFDRLKNEGIKVVGSNGQEFNFKNTDNKFAEARRNHLASKK